MAIEGLAQRPTDQQIAEAAQADALRAARLRLESEYASDRQRAQAANDAVQASRRDAEQNAVAWLAVLRPMYEKRAQAAQALSKALAEFASCENEIRQALAPIGNALAPGMSGMMNDQRDRLWVNLRTAAGLLAQHGDSGAPGLDRLARTVIGGLIGGAIGAGFIQSGRSTTSFE